MIERYAHGGVIDANTWKIGEQCYTPGIAGDAMKQLDDPHASPNLGFTIDDNPDHYSERYTGTSDNGGVHVNNGIPSKAFFLLAVGGTHHLGGSAVGIGADKAEKIWYRALTVYLTSSSSFAGARAATINAANDLYGAGGPEAVAVANVWCLVGVGVSSGVCPSQPAPEPGSELIVNGGFEGSVSPWVLGGAGAGYANPGNVPHAGSGYVYLGISNSTSGQASQTISIPGATAPNLSFWLNVTSDETTTTTAFDHLFVEVRDTSGALLTTLASYSNLNKGAGYALKGPFNLSAYAGQTVRVQFRATTDSSLPTIFRIDDVSAK